MIDDHANEMLVILQIMSPSFKFKNYDVHFLIIRVSI